MGKFHIRFTAWLLVLCLVTALAPGALADGDISADAYIADEYRVLATDNEWNALIAINDLRAEYGLEPLALLGEIQEAATVRAGELDTYFGHLRPDDTGWSTVFQQAGYAGVGTTYAAAEIIATPFITGEGLVAYWAQHDDSLSSLLGDFAYIGIAHNVNTDTWCALLVQGAPHEEMELRDNPDRTVIAGQGMAGTGEVVTLTGAYGQSYIPLSDGTVRGVNTGKVGRYTGAFSVGEMVITFPVEVLFSDVNYAGEGGQVVRFVVQAGLFNGMSDTTFEPESTMTRAMFVTVLGRQADSMGRDLTASGSSFSDVAQDEWYTPYIGWAETSGIAQGYGDTFGIMDNVTREQMAVFLIRFMDYAEAPVEWGPVEYADRGQVEWWALDAVDRALALGLLSLTEDGMVRPDEPATRLEVASAMAVLVQNYL